jgi:dihydroorotate dehydrogenase electron transfer subunit
MIQEHAPVHSVREIASNIFQLSFRSPTIARQAIPGQFVNVKVGDAAGPLLRRPFSIFSIEKETVSIIFNVVGPGTKILSQKETGELLDVLGPLGRGVFPYDDEQFQTALLVAGGLGVASLPFLNSQIPPGKKRISFLGARTAAQIVRVGLESIFVATDDGSEGFHGTVVDLFRIVLDRSVVEQPRIFSCGPLPMMRALKDFARTKNIQCYVALECEMACGVGLCQGCPVETLNGNRRYDLVCREGPVFEASRVNF